MINKKFKNNTLQIIKKSLLLFTIFYFLFSALFSFAEESYTIKTGISIDSVPKNFYGTWRVSSKLITTNNEEIFKKNSVDLWNLSRSNDVITLENPFSGAKASVVFDEINGNFLKFKKIGNYDARKLTDTIKLNLSKETFSGVNELKLDTISEIDGHVIKTEWAQYSLKGEKISGETIK